MIQRPGLFLKRGLLLFWSAWLTIVFATNCLDGCQALGWLGDDWVFASGNYAFLRKTTARYGTPDWLIGLLFLGVIGWEGTASVLFWWSCFRFRDGDASSQRWLYIAFNISLTLWLAFAIADELFIAYAVEGTHLRLFTAQLATLLAIALLPEPAPPHQSTDDAGA